MAKQIAAVIQWTKTVSANTRVIKRSFITGHSAGDTWAHWPL
jgi:hypothetical protein